MNNHAKRRSLALAQAMCEARNWEISNLALQKSIYFADMIHKGRTGQPITPEEFQAWDYGPVLPSVYARARIFGNAPIEEGIFPDSNLLSPDELNTVREVADALRNYTPGQLVNITHSSRGAWSRFYRPGMRGISIPKEAEADEYRRREEH